MLFLLQVPPLVCSRSLAGTAVSWERKHRSTPPGERHRPRAPRFLSPSYQPKSSNSPSTSWGTPPQLTPELGEAPRALLGAPAHPLSSEHPSAQEASSFSPEQPTAQWARPCAHLRACPTSVSIAPSAHSTPHFRGTPPIHLRTPSSASALSERLPEAPPYLLRRQLHMQGAGGRAGR